MATYKPATHMHNADLGITRPPIGTLICKLLPTGAIRPCSMCGSEAFSNVLRVTYAGNDHVGILCAGCTHTIMTDAGQDILNIV